MSRLLADRLSAPLLVWSRAGAIEFMNAAAERLLGWQRHELEGSPWSQLFSPEQGGDPDAWLAEARRGVVTTARLRALTRDARALRVEANLSPFGDGSDKGILVTVRSVAEADESEARSPARAYSISMRQDAFGRLDFVSQNGRTLYVEGDRCYRHFYDRDEPCERCPVLRAPDAPWPRAAIRPAPDGGAYYELVEAEKLETGKVWVTTRSVREEELRGLFSSKLENLALRAGLTERERAVLEELMDGRAPEDIATLLDVSPRTVKFHQSNLLRKLGAESRNDLLRLLF